MTVDRMRELWPVAKTLHEARRDLAWGRTAGERREPWPEFSMAYPHSPIAYVDLALAQADAIRSSRPAARPIGAKLPEMSISNIKAEVCCDGCGCYFSVDLDPARKLPAEWSSNICLNSGGEQ